MALSAVLPLEWDDSPQDLTFEAHYSYKSSQHPRNESHDTTMDPPISHPPDMPTTPNLTHRQLNLPQAAAIQGTPNNRGSASRSHIDDASGLEERAQRVCLDYDDYIREDLSKHRVYISFESGLQTLLHVPEKWNSPGQDYHRIINRILRDNKYKQLQKVYFELCDTPGPVEPSLYKPQTNFYNYIISLINRHSRGDYRKKEDKLLYFKTNHPKHISQGIFHGLNPDITGKRKTLADRDPLVWPMIVHIEEMKDSDVALDRGRDSPRAMGPREQDPLSVHRSPSRKALTASNKRKYEGDELSANKIPRITQTSTPSTKSNTPSGSTPTENQTTAGARLQCARYLMEMLELSVLRSHAFLTLVDRDHLQLMYADRSAVVTTSIIDCRTPEGEAMFLAMLIAFHRLTPKQWGLLPLVKNSFTVLSSGDTAYHREDDSITSKRECLRGLGLQLQGKIKRRSVRLMLEDILYHQPGIIGRGTCVIAASCNDVKDWKGQELVVKVSWPSETRKSEIFLLNLARRKGEELVKERKVKQADLFKEVENLRESGKFEEATAKSHDAQSLVEEFDKHWALNHLPNILHSEDFQLGSENEPMPQTKLALFFSKAEYVNGEFKYETRVLRVSVQERLYKMTTLPSLVGYAQVFYDVFLCHRWLYDYPYILHRDISSGNIMYRIIDGKIYGVLNDLDLSSLRKSVEEGEQTSLQRTGTPPYMAVDLLRSGTRHLYRHDLESLVYVNLLLCCRNKFVPGNPLERLPQPKLNDWFDTKATWSSLGEKKYTFLGNFIRVDSLIHPSFKDFIPSLNQLLDSISDGFSANNLWLSALRKYEAKSTVRVGRGATDASQGPPEFDYETLGGAISFESIAGSLSSFKGKDLEHRSKDQLGSSKDHGII